jgi:hypothetical protein
VFLGKFKWPDFMGKEKKGGQATNTILSKIFRKVESNNEVQGNFLG